MAYNLYPLSLDFSGVLTGNHHERSLEMSIGVHTLAYLLRCVWRHTAGPKLQLVRDNEWMGQLWRASILIIISGLWEQDLLISPLQLATYPGK